ncbi:TlpA family protein disulfide reductase [Rothia sp. P13129]|uniref:TlpA family protein disulfide reductase n=1 Tax=unclassified Rothia (in: high G+C Gram-positive bacteria) TaxID=2689056 RepID=UPI003AD08E9F
MLNPHQKTPEQRLSRRHLLSFGAAAGVLTLNACSSSDSLSAQADAGDSKGYIAGDGSVTEFPPEKRTEPVHFTGTLYDGTEITAESLRGKPILLNFWYAGCAPCRAEAPALVKLHKKFADKVHFYGVNVRDEKATAEAFERRFSVEYPSFEDSTGKVLYELSQVVPAQAVPTTLIIDAQGRVTSRVLGQIDESIVRTLLEDAQK